MVQPKRLQSPKEGSYNAQSYIDDYVKFGVFPKIYDDFGLVVRTYAKENEPSMDLGSCTGLMAAYNIYNGRSSCVGIEGNKADFDRSIDHPSTVFSNFYIGPDTLQDIAELIYLNDTTLITARRVFPEICEMNGIKFMYDMAEVFHKAGVKKIVLEGRTPVPNPAARLHNIELECQSMAGFYSVSKRWRRVAMLVAK